MTEFPWREVEGVAGLVADARAALASALPWWRADAGARVALERLGAGQVEVEVVAVVGGEAGAGASGAGAAGAGKAGAGAGGAGAGASGRDGEVLLLEAPGLGVVAGVALDPVFTQLLVARLLGDAEPELPAPRALGPGERGLARYLGAAALDALGASWLAGEVVSAEAALPLLGANLAGAVAVDIMVTQLGATPAGAAEPVSVTAATVATPSPQSPPPPPSADAPATRVAIRVRSPQHPTPTATRAATAVSATPAAARTSSRRGRYRLLLSPSAMSALASSPARAGALTPRALARLEHLPICFRASAGVATLAPAELAALAIGDVVVLDRSRGGLHAGRTHLSATLSAPAPAASADTLTLTMSAPPTLAEVHSLMPTDTDSAARLTDLPIELTAELGRITLSARAALDLAPGAIVRLGRPPGPIELTAQGKSIARGELVLIDGELGIRVTGL
ncbi:MAG: FliM/FliN family flagellar motor switch protein [Deltaproteobacteria bacterium]|nr:FliM/FliN family flagellar motor switch protein [Deltaproteobacteria bacterium]